MAGNDKGVLRFLFDYVSPYAYLGWVQIHSLADEFKRKVLPVPVLFSGLLQAHGTYGPVEVPAKRAYIFKDALRRANMLNIPLSMPPTHPFNPLLALRVSSAPMDDSVRRKLIDRLFAATWGSGKGVTEQETIGIILEEVGLDRKIILAAANSVEIKDLLRRNTEEAIAQSVFGVPTVLVDGELFWGQDSFPSLARFLAGDEQLDTELLARWATLRSSTAELKHKGYFL